MLTERQKLILSLIIQNFTHTGQPVGSKSLMEEGVKASSATIRNDMKTLEELGLLEKTHSSSGRIPSALGYRYYVDHLLTPIKVSNQEADQIRSSLKKDIHEIDDIIQQSARILSQVTSYTAFSLGPEMKDRTLTGFRIVTELGNDLFDHLSMIQANYEIRGHGRGPIALLGPTSMPYSKIFGLLDVFRYELTNALDDYYRSLDLYH